MTGLSATTEKKALIMAGGTGGHIFPGMAVAKSLIASGWQVSWLGSKGGMEESLVTKSIPLNLISIKGLRGNGLLGWLKMPFSLTKAIIESIQVMRDISPSVVIGFGGFASGPGGIAAFLTRKPLLIHEQNAIAGMTNKCLSKLARHVFQAFPKTFKASAKVKTIGNPVREEILQVPTLKKQLSTQETAENLEQAVNIFVMGGSRGALAFNTLLPSVFSELAKDKKICVKHQVGRGKLQQANDFYQEANLAKSDFVELFEFIDDVAEVLTWADVVIARAGASTVSEISAAGIATIFVPYPYAVDDHQAANADWLVKAQAALSFREEELAEPIFVKSLTELVGSQEKRQMLANNAISVAYLNATDEITDYCTQLAKHLTREIA